MPKTDQSAALPQLVSADQLIESLGVTRQTIMRWVKAGEFPKPTRIGRRILRWDVAEVNQWREQKD